MRTHLMKRCALALVTAGAVVALTSEPARAAGSSSRLMDACSATCPGGGCEASTSWYVFWDDCLCTCTGDGRPTCSCS
jgi:hypothetical protein